MPMNREHEIKAVDVDKRVRWLAGQIDELAAVVADGFADLGTRIDAGTDRSDEQYQRILWAALGALGLMTALLAQAAWSGLAIMAGWVP